ncbi:uncharacterized protein [Diadema antillarum]|uniref:uncharacterized protein n=1 Tax=Diadema antillarum TaxID=105358 RepID=UPI003A89D5F4
MSSFPATDPTEPPGPPVRAVSEDMLRGRSAKANIEPDGLPASSGVGREKLELARENYADHHKKYIDNDPLSKKNSKSVRRIVDSLIDSGVFSALFSSNTMLNMLEYFGHIILKGNGMSFNDGIAFSTLEPFNRRSDNAYRKDSLECNGGAPENGTSNNLHFFSPSTRNVFVLNDSGYSDGRSNKKNNLCYPRTNVTPEISRGDLIDSSLAGDTGTCWEYYVTKGFEEVYVRDDEVRKKARQNATCKTGNLKFEQYRSCSNTHGKIQHHKGGSGKTSRKKWLLNEWRRSTRTDRLHLISPESASIIKLGVNPPVENKIDIPDNRNLGQIVSEGQQGPLHSFARLKDNCHSTTNKNAIDGILCKDSKVSTWCNFREIQYSEDAQRNTHVTTCNFDRVGKDNHPKSDNVYQKIPKFCSDYDEVSRMSKNIAGVEHVRVLENRYSVCVGVHSQAQSRIQHSVCYA